VRSCTGLPTITWHCAAPFVMEAFKAQHRVVSEPLIAQSLETWVYLISQTACKPTCMQSCYIFFLTIILAHIHNSHVLDCMLVAVEICFCVHRLVQKIHCEINDSLNCQTTNRLSAVPYNSSSNC